MIIAYLFQYLMWPIKSVFYLAPMIFFILLTFSKQLKFLESSKFYCSLTKISNIKYFSLSVGIQLAFYLLTFWLFSCYVYQTENNISLTKIDIYELVNILQTNSYLYMFLPQMLMTVCGIGLLYFVTNDNRSPFLTESFYHQPARLPWLFLHNSLMAVEIVSGFTVIYIVFITLLLILSHSLGFMSLGFNSLTNPFLYMIIIMPICFLINQYSRNVIGWFMKNKYSMGLLLVAYLIILLAIIFMLMIFFHPLFSVLAKKYELSYSLLNIHEDNTNMMKFELLLLSWFLINIPKLSSIIGKLSYGFSVRRALFLNLLASYIVFLIVQYFTQYMGSFYEIMRDPFILFFSSLFVILFLWLYASYVKNNLSLWAGPMGIFSTIHIKRRSITGFIYRCSIILLVMFSGLGFLGWKLSQFWISVLALGLIAVFLGFYVKMITVFIKNMLSYFTFKQPVFTKL